MGIGYGISNVIVNVNGHGNVIVLAVMVTQCLFATLVWCILATAIQ